MNIIKIIVVSLLVLIISKAVFGKDKGSMILWQIGSVDKDTSDLAFRPQNYVGFKQTGFFVVGHSDPGKDWPYLHPGPADRWASKRSCRYDILFELASISKSGDCKLIIDLADTHNENPPKLEITINGKTFTIQLPPGSADEGLWKAEVGSHGQRGDNTTSLAGKSFQLTIPFSSKLLLAGTNRITITAVEGNFMLYDAVSLKASAATKLIKKPQDLTAVHTIDPLPLVQKKEGRVFQPVKVTLFHLGEDTTAQLTLTDSDSVEVKLAAGLNTAEILTKKVDVKRKADLVITVAGESIASDAVTISPVRDWEIYLIHQTHVDIGYTGYQPDIEKKGWGYLEQAIELSEKTKDYPSGAQFKWNPEVTWAVESYLENASEEKCDKLIDAVKKGWIGLDALYMSELTGLCRPQELFHLVKGARRLNKKYGLNIDSAMIGDVPGCTWGTVEALSKSGIKYFNMGINYWPYRRDIKYGVDWGGKSLKEWGDKPFYWLSQSGKERILFWMNGRGYSWFPRVPLDAEIISYELKRLEDIDYPYDITHLRHTVGGDNGPPYPPISTFVKNWNEKYASPKMIISTNSGMFHKFEARYADQIPTASGDFTPHWERVIAVGAEQAVTCRATSVKLLQSQSLWAMLDRGDFPQDDFDSAWRGMVTFNEHTWGCLVFLPEEKRRKMWDWKVADLAEAESLATKLVTEVTRPKADSNTIDVFNTCSWSRTDLVTLSKEQSTIGDIIKNASGKTVQSQRLKSGELAFLATDIPAFGAKRYTVNPGKATTKGNAKATTNSLSSNSLHVAVDETSGAIKSLRWLRKGVDFASDQKKLNVCTYLTSDQETVTSTKITVEEAGPLVASLLIESGKPGNHQLTRRLQLVDGLNHVSIANTMGVEEVHKNSNETVRFSFEFAIDDPTTRLDIPWGIIRTGTDQLPGSCDAVTLTSWFDVSNNNVGATCAVVDVPMVEFEPDKNKPQVVNSIATQGYGLSHYKDAYGVPLTFRYAIAPHTSFKPANAAKFGIERASPLIAVSTDPHTKPITPLLEITHNDVIATSLKPAANNDDIIIQLYNVSGKPKKVNITSKKLSPNSCLLVDPDSDRIKTTALPLDLAAYELLNLRLQRK